MHKNPPQQQETKNQQRNPEMMTSGIQQQQQQHTQTTTLLAEFAAPKDPKKYALRLMGILFSSEEMIRGMVVPLNPNPKSNKEELDNVRIELLKSKL